MYDYEEQDAGDNSGGPAPQSDPYSQIRALYQQITGGKYTPTDADVSQWGQNIDASYYDKIRGAIGNWWQQYQAAQPAPTGAQEASPPPTGGNGGSPAPTTTPDIYSAPLTAPYSGTFTAPPNTPYPTAPIFQGPQFPTIPKFQAPSADDALNDPGYQFVRDQGRDSLQNWAAARGTLNDSSTAKSLEDYGQSAAQQQYANVYGRRWNEYGADVQNNYFAPFAAQERNWEVGTVNPQLNIWQTQLAATQHDNDLGYLNEWNKFLDAKNSYYNWQDRVFNKQFQTATA